MDTGASHPPICVAAPLFRAQTGVRTDHSRTFMHSYAAPHAPLFPSVSLCGLSRHPRTQSLLALDEAATKMMRQLPRGSIIPRRWRSTLPPLQQTSRRTNAWCSHAAADTYAWRCICHVGVSWGFMAVYTSHARGARHRIMTACAIAKRRQNML